MATETVALFLLTRRSDTVVAMALIRRNLVRIGLDVAMLVVLVLMYEAQVIAIRFHEVGGLAVFGLFIIHHLINWRWISGVSRRFLGASLPLKTRLGYVLNVVLLVDVAVIAVTGIMISRTILTGIYGTTPLWRYWHLFSAALALILVGIHTGLHWSFIRSTFAKVVRLPRTVARPLGIALLALVVGFGVYSIITSNFVVWLMALLAMIGDVSLELQMRLQGGGALPGSPLEVVATFGSIVVLFAAATAAIEYALKK